ncbi:MAG: hypothetical protein LBI33_02140, partial [Propionibacteriaceae bacterium]|nr:hypothetical protein [Propionibacteriaceae bacterium]
PLAGQASRLRAAATGLAGEPATALAVSDFVETAPGTYAAGVTSVAAGQYAVAVTWAEAGETQTTPVTVEFAAVRASSDLEGTVTAPTGGWVARWPGALAASLVGGGLTAVPGLKPVVRRRRRGVRIAAHD